MSEYSSPAEYTSRLRHNILQMPPEIQNATGIVINGRRLKSLVFTTDIAIIKNCDADGVFAVYPFTPQQSISDALIKHSSMPATLLELAFITNPREEKLLGDDKYQSTLAKAIVRGISRYFGD